MVRLEARPANIEGNGQVTIRDLVRNALRMRPDRIIVGEVRGAEALDMLQAMNTGHDGSLTTVHANAPRDALARLETMVLMAGFDLPTRAIREQIASALNLIVQIERSRDGSDTSAISPKWSGMEGEIITLAGHLPVRLHDQGAGADRRASGVRGQVGATRHHAPERTLRRIRCVVTMTRPLRIVVALVLSAPLAVTGVPVSERARAQEPTDSLEVILAIDASASMRPAIEAAKVAANEFVAAMPPDVRIGLETFADQVTVLTPPTTDRALLAAQIDSIVADGDTALYDVVVGAGSTFHADGRAQGARACCRMARTREARRP